MNPDAKSVGLPPLPSDKVRGYFARMVAGAPLQASLTAEDIENLLVERDSLADGNAAAFAAMREAFFALFDLYPDIQDAAETSTQWERVEDAMDGLSDAIEENGGRLFETNEQAMAFLAAHGVTESDVEKGRATCMAMLEDLKIDAIYADRPKTKRKTATKPRDHSPKCRMCGGNRETCGHFVGGGAR